MQSYLGVIGHCFVPKEPKELAYDPWYSSDRYGQCTNTLMDFNINVLLQISRSLIAADNLTTCIRVIGVYTAHWLAIVHDLAS